MQTSKTDGAVFKKFAWQAPTRASTLSSTPTCHNMYTAGSHARQATRETQCKRRNARRQHHDNGDRALTTVTWVPKPGCAPLRTRKTGSKSRLQTRARLRMPYWCLLPQRAPTPTLQRAVARQTQRQLPARVQGSLARQCHPLGDRPKCRALLAPPPCPGVGAWLQRRVARVRTACVSGVGTDTASTVHCAQTHVLSLSQGPHQRRQCQPAHRPAPQ